MIVKNIFYIFIGVAISFSYSVLALTVTEKDMIEESQTYALKYTGMYQPDVTKPDFQIHTYEKLCKGYYVMENNGVTVRLTGFGDLADEYTYSYDLDIPVDLPATTTKPDKLPSGVDIGSEPSQPLDM